MSLDASDRKIVRLFCACVLGRWDVALEVRRSADGREPDRRWREALLQVHVFAGFPRGVEAYGVLRGAGGLGTPDEDESKAGDTLASDTARGRALFERIYRADAPRVRAMLAESHSDFAAWIEDHAYGRVLARPGLAADRRELLAVVALAALGQEKQLASHARGAVRTGATPEDVMEALAAVADLMTSERYARARSIVEQFAR
ncbi:MAG: carboxymuconolactone decarboxylase family protein [Planctomycetota bacterium]